MSQTSEWSSQYFFVTVDPTTSRSIIDLGYPRILLLKLEEYFLMVPDAVALNNVVYLRIERSDVNIQKSESKDRSLIPLILPTNTTHVIFPQPFPLIEQPLDSNQFECCLIDANGQKLNFSRAYLRFRAYLNKNPMLHGIRPEDFDNTYRQPIRGGW